MELAVCDLFHARWTNDIHNEWIKSVHADRPDISLEKLNRTRKLMDTHVRDAIVFDYEPLIQILDLPDPDDRHVLAAAIKSKSDCIITFNEKDFPSEKLKPWGIEIIHPDDFLTHQFHLSQPTFLSAIKAVRMRLKKNNFTPSEYLDVLRKQGLLATVQAIEPFDQFF